MSRRIFSALMLSLLLIGMLTSAFNFQSVKAVLTTIVVPDDYPTIQGAINNANSGDNIFVRSGTYNENLKLNKSISLFGENAINTIVDGMYKDDVIQISANKAFVKGFTIINSKRTGPWLYSSINSTNVTNCSIEDNTILNSSVGIWLWNCSNIIICGNDISNLTESIGIRVDYSHSITIYSNDIHNSPSGILLEDSDNNVVYKNKLEDNDYLGLSLVESDGNLVLQNTISNTSIWFNVELYSSCWNTIRSNVISNSPRGLQFAFSTNNVIFHNSFVNNTVQAYELYREYQSESLFNSWDEGYPLGGNYWSDYNRTDLNSGPYQNLTGSDGIGDSSYVIDSNNTDHYPLMKSYAPLFGDVNDDGKVNMLDIGIVASCFGSWIGELGYNLQADINLDSKVDLRDIALIAKHFGEHL